MNSIALAPNPPHMSDWTFIDQFKIFQRTIQQKRLKKCISGQVDLSQGVNLGQLSEDITSRLETAYRDFSRFLSDLQIPHNCGYKISFKIDHTLPRETFVLEVKPSGSSVRVADIEAARRAIYFLMDEIVSSEGAFLTIKDFRLEPFVKIRISRCYFGPKKRPPLSKDELMAKPNYTDILLNDPEYRDELIDGFDYFPDAYLSRLARDRVNGLWLVGYFNEICKSKIIPEYGDDSDKRLKRLQEIVEKCARYGIKIYIFCMEPSGFGERIPLGILNAHPEFKGNHSGDAHFFCTSTEKGRAYIEESTYYLFSQVSGLGGLINLCVGERQTNCCSGYIIDGVENYCPRCSKRKPAEVVGEVLEIMKRAMTSANPDAELIAWPYSQYITWGEENTVEAVAYMPDNVILMHNFESRGRIEQLNKERVLDDYWLAYPGPSQLFKDCANVAIKNNIKFGAKVQTSCSYELATVPFVPVPGILYKKYKAMRELQVSTVMQCWLVGSCPSVMTQAAGMLSFETFPKTEQEFLLKLAAIDWGNSAKTVARAWEYFQKGYENYPYARVFAYYSPMNAGVVWPLFLLPRDKELYPPFRANRPPCGDRIGECLMDEFTLEEAIELCGKMTHYWSKGIKLLNDIADKFSNDDRQKDIGVAHAVGIQIKSTYNILTFYYLREEMAWCHSFDKKKELLDELKKIVCEEIKNTKKLNKLAIHDSRLGFQADSESHIYFPAKLEWRIQQLEQLLTEEFPQVEAKIATHKELFPEYTGKDPGKYFSHSIPVESALSINDLSWKNIPCQKCEQIFLDKTDKSELIEGRYVKWQSIHTNDALYVKIHCADPDMASVKQHWNPTEYTLADCVELIIEKQRLWSPQKFVASVGGDTLYVQTEKSTDYQWSAEVVRRETDWEILFCIPWIVLGFNQIPVRPVRINLRRIIPDHQNDGYVALSWGGCYPLMHRLLQQNDNPADFGWLFLNENAGK
ncbi:MAG: hypothetical protein L3J71_02795 [Victivallaceae bacterium]|nr:hypothetical protein [Victivallaceae bacterium]